MPPHRPTEGEEGSATTEEGRSRRRYDPSWDDWKRSRRWPGVVLTCVVVLAFIGVVVWHYRPMPAPHHREDLSFPKVASSDTAFVVGSTGRGVSVRSFHGTKSRSALRFTTDGKLLVLHAACACTYNFVVTIVNADGTPVAFPVTENGGSSNASLNLTLPAGAYTASVVAPQPAVWTLEFIQPGPATPVLPTPFVFFSDTDSVVGPFSATNRYLYFRFFSEANGTADVYVLNPAGVRVDQAFSGRTYVEGPQTLPNPSNPFYVEVDASGLWKLRVQQSSKG